jgi:hypothetical protein
VGLRPEQPHHGLHNRCPGLTVGLSVPARSIVSKNAAGSVPGGTSEGAAEHP